MNRSRRRRAFRPLTPLQTQPSANRPSKSSAVGHFQWYTQVEAITKILAFLAVACYVLGLVSVNGYLLHLGVSDFSLVRPRFIYTGALEVFWLLLSLGLPAAIFRATYALFWSRRQIWELLRGVVLIVSFTVVSISTAVSALNALFLESLGEFTFTREAAVVTIPVQVLGVITALLIWLLRKSEPKVHGKTLAGVRSGSFAAGAVGILTYLVICIVVFMSFAYPNIPVQLGGGYPQEVVFAIKKEHIGAVKQLGLPLDGKDGLTKSVQLLYEGSQSYVIRLGTDEVIELKRDQVVATRVEGNS